MKPGKISLLVIAVFTFFLFSALLLPFRMMGRYRST